jgi:hypothetical protein
MMSINELEQLAKAVYAPNKDDWELKQALLHFDRAANPETILRLIELLREMAGALVDLDTFADSSDDCQYGTLSTSFVKDVVGEALAKYKEMTK